MSTVSSPKCIPWIEWLCHSNFSFLMGASHPEQYVQRASELAYRALGICDFDGLYGIVRAHRQQQRQVVSTGKGFPIFYGAEIHISTHHHRPIVLKQTIVLYALNHKGYQQLCQIINHSHRYSKNNAFISLDELQNFERKDLVCLQPMRGMIREESLAITTAHYARLSHLFPQRFYLVVSRHLNPAEDSWIQPTLKIGKKLKTPFLMSQDAFFHQAEEKDLCDIVQAIRLNQTMDDAVSHFFVNDERCLRNLNEIYARYRPLPCFHDALANSLDLADQFSFSLNEICYRYPQEMIPTGFTSQSYLEHIVWKALKDSLRSSEQLRATLQKELQLIRILEFADYFLTVWDIVAWARKQGILCQGRGSAANSAVCYMLGITSVDPTLFDLLFERFLSLERGDPPDIDIDFEHERREEVIQYIYARYGRPRAAMVANIITFRSRGAIRAVGKALGLSEDLLCQASQSQKLRIYRKKDLKDLPISTKQQDIPWQLWERLSHRLKGFPRHMGVHSGGFIISHNPLDTIVPQEPATMEGRTVIQWAKEDIESLHLFKIDVLALGMLTAIRKSLDMVQIHYDQKLTLSDIPHDDQQTYQMIQQADTVGTFQIESRAQMSMLPRLRPERFYDLVVQVGIIRPGPIQGGLIHPFLRRRRGLEAVVFPHPKLKPILERTLGVPIFQEQIMRVAMAVGDFTPGEADYLRKQIGSWSLSKDLGHLIAKLEKGMRKNGIEEHFIQQILKQLEGFANYGFPESHAASFALLAYASSYLKCHFKEAFYTAILNSQPMGFYSCHALVQAARREGCLVLPICINQSQWDCTLEETKDKGGLGIRLGMRLVRGLSQIGAMNLIKTRHKKGTWQDIYQFLQQRVLHRADLTSLVAANALASLDIPRHQAIWIAAAAPLAELFDEEDSCNLPHEDDLSTIERDFASFGTTLGEHPTEIIRREYWHYPIPLSKITASNALKKLVPNQLLFVFGMVLVRQSPLTAKGMVFFTLEDQDGFINLVFTPQISEQYSTIINQQGFLCVEGKLQREQEGHSILVKRVYEARKPSNVIDMTKIPHTEATLPIRATRAIQRTRNYI